MNVRRVVLALASLLFLAQALPASASARIVRLSYLDGNVQIDRNRAAGIENAILNMPVVEGTRIFAGGDDARVEIEFENGSTMRLVGPAEVNFRQLGSIESGDMQTVVEIVRGVAYFDVKLHDNDDFRVMLRDRDIAIRKSSHFRVQIEDAQTMVAVFRGEVELQGVAGRVVVKKDETLTLDSGDQDRYFLARNVVPLATDQFDKDRNDYRNSYAKSNAYNYTGTRYGSPYTYGMSDLASYGDYAYYPGYGYLWRPVGAAYGPGWDPFSYGAWSFYPQFGWVYVSSYPWGWTPYRYGQWVTVPGYGWCWSPYGGVGNNWYPVPVVRPPQGPRRGPNPIPIVRPPQLAGGPTISVGGGGLTGRPEPPDIARRPFPAQGPHRPERRGVGNPNPAVAPAANALAPSGKGAITTQGGAVVPQGGAVTPVVPGLRQPGEPVRERRSPKVAPEAIAPPPSAPPATAPRAPAVAPATDFRRSEPSRPAAVPQPPMRPMDSPRSVEPPRSFEPPRGVEPQPAPVTPPAGRDRGADPKMQSSSRHSSPAPNMDRGAGRSADRGSSRQSAVSMRDTSASGGRGMGSSAGFARGSGSGGSRDSSGGSRGGDSHSSRH